MLHNPSVRRLLLLPLCAFLLTGCGKSGVTVKGTVILPQGTKLVESDFAQITFRPEDTGGQPSSAKIQPDGSFIATRVYPDKNTISIELAAYAGQPESQKRDEAFKLTNKAFAPGKSPLTYDATSDFEQSIIVDLPRGKVKKQ
jgi:hypothetical protein